MLARTKYIKSFHELLETSEKQYIAIIWEENIGKSTFLETLKEDKAFSKKNTLWISPENLEISNKIRIADTIENIIIDGNVENISIIRTFIESKSFENTVIFISTKKIDEVNTENFLLPWVSFREYAESESMQIDIGKILSGISDVERLNILRDTYIQRWYFPHHIDDPTSIVEDFDTKCTIMKEELFDKEHGIFIEYMRTLAMNTWNLFKADQLAKLLSLSRRKIHKYTEILMKHNVIKAIGPWVENVETETSRHVKIYFSDLSFMKSLLGDLYFQGQMKQWVIENFVFLEIERKLGTSHKIHFYRKKSGAEISFVLENIENTMLTVIDVSQKNVNTPSQALKSFDTSYHTRVERYMILNESIAMKKDIWWVSLLILPHIAI